MQRKVSTLLVDPDRLCREGLVKLLEATPYEVVEQVASIDEVIDGFVPGKEPELCLVVYALGDTAEVERVAQLREYLSDTRIVVLSTLASAHLVAQSLEVGVDAFLLKDMSADSLLRTLDLVMIGEMVMPTQLATLLINSKPGSLGTPAPGRKVHGMSVREAQILRCLVGGGANKVIATQLDITEATVKVHIKGILKKINVANRTQAAVWAIKHGLAEDVAEVGRG